MSPSREVREGLVNAIPNLRAFAMSLCGRSAWADDLVQETLVRAWAKADTYKDGTNLMAWLFTILRNEFYSQLRKRKREVEDVDGEEAGRLTSAPAQSGNARFQGGACPVARRPARGDYLDRRLRFFL
jgi:RNA polymerase sigma-70 factor (ECF subfamily)